MFLLAEAGLDWRWGRQLPAPFQSTWWLWWLIPPGRA